MGKLKTNEEWVSQVYDLVGEEYTFLEDYVTARTLIKVKHNTCGHTYKVCPDKFRIGRRCPKCSGKYRRTNEDFLEWAKEVVGDEYTFLSPYVNLKTHIEVIHNECGYKYKMNPGHFIHSGKRCPKCAGVLKMTDAEYAEKVSAVWGDEYEILGKYDGYHKKIEVRHTPCGKIYNIPASSLLKRRSCLCSSRSLGEISVARVLDSLNVSYIEEWRIGNKLRADFYLPKYRAVIEFDGKQHFEPREAFGGEDAYREVVFRDKVKDHYCDYTSIKMLRIPYWRYSNIKEEVENFIYTLEREEE